MESKNFEQMTPEELQAEFDAQFGEALAYVVNLVKSDNAIVVRSMDKNTEQNLVLIDRFIQAMYYGNIKEGNFEEAILGLMTGVRAAFLVGYLYKQADAVLKTLGPVNKKDLQ